MSWLMMRVTTMEFEIDFSCEEDGRWIAEVVELPGVLTYGVTKAEALRKAKILAGIVLADRLGSGIGSQMQKSNDRN